MMVNIIKVYFNMRNHFSSTLCMSVYHPIASSEAQIKPITSISLLSVLWAFLMVTLSTTNAEALNGDNHLTRSKIFEEKGN
jgi:hypothetical protein